MNNWKTVWSNRKVEIKDDTLSSLIQLDGFDTGFGTYDKDSWSSMVLDFAKKTRINKGQNILEIGCGAGAFLYVLDKTFECNLFGIDYSDVLIQEARKNISRGIFDVKEAKDINFDSGFFDLIFAHSVFQYFDSLDYSMEVIKKSFDQIRPGGVLALLDINDEEFFSQYHLERSGTYKNKKDYQDKYYGLDHLFFDKDSLVDGLLSLGFSDVYLYSGDPESYANSKYRFNLIAKK